LEIASKTKSWHPIARNGWIVKFSIYRETNILVTVISQYTGQTILRHFLDEDNACLFINYVLDLDAEEINQL
jgi:hypothetical protein